MPENIPVSDQAGTLTTGPTAVSTSAPPAWTAMLRGTLTAAWQPKTIPPPKVDPDLTKLAGIERSAEVLRYMGLQLEYALSADGGLRAWLQLNVLACCILAIPTLLVVPVVTWLLSAFTTWSGFLFRTALNLFYTAIAFSAFVAVVMALIYGVKAYVAFMRQDSYIGKWTRR